MKSDFLYWIFYLGVFLCFTSCTDSQSPPQISKEPTHKQQTEVTADLPKNITQNQEDRSIWQRPDIVLSSLGNIKDKVIADLGAGTGYFTWRLIPHAQKIIALDIDEEAIQHLDSMSTFLPDAYKSQLEIRKTRPNRADLSQNEADIVLIVNTYTFLPNRIQYLSELRSVLPEGGRLLIIDFKKKRIPIGPDSANRIALYRIEEELIQAGFEDIISDDQSLNYQYIVTAKK